MLAWLPLPCGPLLLLLVVLLQVPLLLLLDHAGRSPRLTPATTAATAAQGPMCMLLLPCTPWLRPLWVAAALLTLLCTPLLLAWGRQLLQGLPLPLALPVAAQLLLLLLLLRRGPVGCCLSLWMPLLHLWHSRGPMLLLLLLLVLVVLLLLA